MKPSKSTLAVFMDSGILLLGLCVFLVSGCELIDPTEVRNPQITSDSFIGQAGSTQAATQGIRNNFAAMMDNTAYYTDVVSDNYDNTATFISPIADNPSSIQPTDLTLNGAGSLYGQAQTLRAQSTFFIDVVAPADPNQVAAATFTGDLKFFRGMASLILAENFSYAPLTTGGAPVSAATFIGQALADFQAALTTASTTAPSIRTAAQYAIARAHRLAGSKALAVSAATTALGLAADFVYSSPYDAATNTNDVYAFVVSRALRDMQPLPRLDFLDPKYTTNVAPIAALKSEEMHLIIAEGAISDNNLAQAKTSMKSAITQARGTTQGRATINFADSDTRTTQAGVLRPNGDTLLVRASSTSPARPGLIRRRSGTTVPIKQLSNTSVLTTDVDTLVSVEDHHWMLYLLRQEIFFLEGRRMSDLGIRLPLIQRDIDASPGMANGSPGTSVVVPGYIPAGDGMDLFTVSAPTVTVTYDMNRMIAVNKVSPFSIP